MKINTPILDYTLAQNTSKIVVTVQTDLIHNILMPPITIPAKRETFTSFVIKLTIIANIGALMPKMFLPF